MGYSIKNIPVINVLKAGLIICAAFFYGHIKPASTVMRPPTAITSLVSMLTPRDPILIGGGLACAGILFGRAWWETQKELTHLKKTNCFITAANVIQRLANVSINIGYTKDILDDRSITKPRNSLDEFWGKYSNLFSSKLFKSLFKPGHFAFYINLIQSVRTGSHALIIEKKPNGTFIVHQSFQDAYDEEMWAGRKPWTGTFHKKLFETYGNSRELRLAEVKDFMNILIRDVAQGSDPRNLPFYVKMFAIPSPQTPALAPSAMAIGSHIHHRIAEGSALAQRLKILQWGRQVLGPYRWLAVQKAALRKTS